MKIELKSKIEQNKEFSNLISEGKSQIKKIQAPTGEQKRRGFKCEKRL